MNPDKLHRRRSLSTGYYLYQNDHASIIGSKHATLKSAEIIQKNNSRFSKCLFLTHIAGLRL